MSRGKQYNLYGAFDDYFDGRILWTKQTVIATSEKNARKVLPFGKHRQIKLLQAYINRPLPKIDLNLPKQEVENADQ